MMCLQVKIWTPQRLHLKNKETETTPTDTSVAAADTTTPEGELSEEEFRKAASILFDCTFRSTGTKC